MFKPSRRFFVWATVAAGAGLFAYYQPKNKKKILPSDDSPLPKNTPLIFTNESLQFETTSNGLKLPKNLSENLATIAKYLTFHVKAIPQNSDGRFSGGTAFVVSPIVSSEGQDVDYIYLVTAAHCVLGQEGEWKQVGLISKPMERIVTNNYLKKQNYDHSIINCQVLACVYDGNNDVDYAILRCHAREFVEKNRFNRSDITSQFFIPKIENTVATPLGLNSMVVGYPSRYKHVMDERVKDHHPNVIDQLMMTREKTPVFSFGNLLRVSSDQAYKFTYHTCTISKGFSGGPSILLDKGLLVGPNNPSKQQPLFTFIGIVTLFDRDGYGSFSASNSNFRHDYSQHVSCHLTPPIITQTQHDLIASYLGGSKQ